MITLGDDTWSAAGWLYRFVLDQVTSAAAAPQSVEVLAEARALGVLDLDDLPPADRGAVRSALGPALLEHFARDLRPDVDAGPTNQLLRELGELAARLPD